jgi:multidrug efflux pump subunit AcrA (membrane-fusion protein)
MDRIRRLIRTPWVVLPVVAALALGTWYTFVRDEPSPATTDLATTQEVEATVGTMARTVSSEGTVAAADSEDLSFSAAGTVTEVHVAAGDQVTAGTVLAVLDSPELEAAVADAEAAVADAEAKLADDTDADASDEQLAADASSLASANDQLAAAQEALDGATLVASFDATVTAVDLTVGEELSSGGQGGVSQTGSQTGSGASSSTLGADSGAGLPGGTSTGDTGTTGSTAQVSLVSTATYVVELGLDDTEVAEVEVGQLVDVSLSSSTGSANGFPAGFGPIAATAGTGSGDEGGEQDAEPAAPTATGDTVEGLVTEVGAVADASSGVASYPVTVAFGDDSGTFNVGATVAVDIVVEEVTDALSVPTRAITTTDQVSTVQVATDDGTETRTVTPGLTSGASTQITDGLEAGETVVIELPTRLGGDTDDGEGAPTGGGGFTPPEGFTPPAGFTPPGLGGGS